MKQRTGLYSGPLLIFEGGIMAFSIIDTLLGLILFMFCVLVLMFLAILNLYKKLKDFLKK